MSHSPRSGSRGRSVSHSRSRSPRSRSPSSRSPRSKSRSYSRGRRRFSGSRSPRRNYRQSQTNTSAPPGKVLGIFGLSGETRESDLREEFVRYGELEDCTLIIDKRSGQSKRFGFVYFKREEDATKAKEVLNGMTLHGNKVRIDYSYTKKPHSPTPGRYMGKISESRAPYSRRYHPYGGSYYSGRRSPPRYDYDYDRRSRDYYGDRYDRYDEYYDRYDDRYRRR